MIRLECREVATSLKGLGRLGELTWFLQMAQLSTTMSCEQRARRVSAQNARFGWFVAVEAGPVRRTQAHSATAFHCGRYPRSVRVQLS